MSDSPTDLRSRMHTLSSWTRKLLRPSFSIPCPSMRLMVRDREVLVEGPGELRVNDASGATYVMHGTPADSAALFSAMVRAQKEPHLHTSQFRLFATDYEGHEWACGFTDVHLSAQSGPIWMLTGTLGSLMTDVGGPGVSPVQGVELVYVPAPRVPMTTVMRTEVKYGDNAHFKAVSLGETTLTDLGAVLQFWTHPEQPWLMVAASTSADLPHPYLENWLSEPFRILVGDHVYPRLVARNFGDGRAMISLRPVPPPRANAARSSILAGDARHDPTQFWALYVQILGLIADTGKADGHPGFNAHQLTAFYHEIAEASAGSNWIVCLTLASTVEGLVRMIYREPLPSEFTTNEISALRKRLVGATDNLALANRVAGLLGLLEAASPLAHLRDLQRLELVSDEQLRAWNVIRNPVSHGNLISPWADAELTATMQHLTDLVHALARIYIGRTHALVRVSGVRTPKV